MLIFCVVSLWDYGPDIDRLHPRTLIESYGQRSDGILFQRHEIEAAIPALSSLKLD